MKYIRTKDGRIAEIVSLNESGYLTTKLYYVDGWEILKIADTIEELFDCFVKIKRKGHCKPYILKFDFKDLPMLKKQAIKYIDSPVYGAIHIEDKGLIYVAKMKVILTNGEIDWVLL